MKIATVKLRSKAPLSFSKYHETAKLAKELANDYEKRTWRERLHYDTQTMEVFIPPMMFANSLKTAAKYLSIPVPGKGKTLYTKHFEAGVIVQDRLMLGIKKDDVEMMAAYVPSDGRRGGSTRVTKYFPIIREWQGTVKFYVVDDIITKDVFEKVLQASGQLIGVGRFRPINWGYYGTFEIVGEIKWTNYEN